MLIWQNDLWLIDHGASLYFHHSWDDYLTRSRSPFSQIRQHTLISFAGTLRETDERFRSRLTRESIEQIINQIPEAWLNHDTDFASHSEHRQAYVEYLVSRLGASSIFVAEAIDAHQSV
jgi:hypothetical protein